MIQRYEFPFNNINLYLVSHAHGDHFNAEMSKSLLIKNKKIEMVTNQETVNSLKERQKRRFTK